MIVDRREFIAACGLAAMPFKLGAATRPGTLDLIYDKPAGEWVEALPIGNGRIGGMIFGRVLQERIQLNEYTLWAGSPYSACATTARSIGSDWQKMALGGSCCRNSAISCSKILSEYLQATLAQIDSA